MLPAADQEKSEYSDVWNITVYGTMLKAAAFLFFSLTRAAKSKMLQAARAVPSDLLFLIKTQPRGMFCERL
jgi:hypothetical protein